MIYTTSRQANSDLVRKVPDIKWLVPVKVILNSYINLVTTSKPSQQDKIQYEYMVEILQLFNFASSSTEGISITDDTYIVLGKHVILKLFPNEENEIFKEYPSSFINPVFELDYEFVSYVDKPYNESEKIQLVLKKHINKKLS